MKKARPSKTAPANRPGGGGNHGWHIAELKRRCVEARPGSSFLEMTAEHHGAVRKRTGMTRESLRRELEAESHWEREEARVKMGTATPFMHECRLPGE